MTDKNQVAVWVYDKGRLTLPRRIREALGVDAGDTVFLKYEPENGQVRLAPAVSPFEVLAEHTVREYREGRTKTLEEYARERGIRLDEQPVRAALDQERGERPARTARADRKGRRRAPGIEAGPV